MKVIRTPVDLDERTFWALAAVAESYGMKVNEYLADVAAAVSKRRLPSDIDPVIVRWRSGLSDSEIAAELGMTNLAVATRRRRFGYPANRRRSTH